MFFVTKKKYDALLEAYRIARADYTELEKAYSRMLNKTPSAAQKKKKPKKRSYHAYVSDAVFKALPNGFAFDTDIAWKATKREGVSLTRKQVHNALLRLERLKKIERVEFGLYEVKTKKAA